jgi:hypothetical protein
LFFAAFFLLAALIAEPALADASAENTWVQKAPMQQARGNLGVAVVAGKIYAIGGSDATALPQSDHLVGANEEYDPLTDTWVSKAPMPTAMCNFAAAVYGNKIYCFESGLTQVYDSVTDTWENKTAMPTNRGGFQANVLGEKIYLVGGHVAIDAYPWENGTNVNEVYDPQTDMWSLGAPLPMAVEGYASAVFDGKLYVFGGGKAYLNLTLGNITQIYDPEADSWSYGSPSPFIATYAHAGATMGVNAPPRIYLFNTEIQVPSDQVYDPVSNTWSVGVAEPTQRSDFGLAVVDDLFYAIGGVNWLQDTFVSNTITLTPLALNEVFTPFGYGTVYYTPSPTPPPPTTVAPFPTALVAAASVASAGIIAVGLLVYFKKRKH